MSKEGAELWAGQLNFSTSFQILAFFPKIHENRPTAEGFAPRLPICRTLGSHKFAQNALPIDTVTKQEF